MTTRKVAGALYVLATLAALLSIGHAGWLESGGITIDGGNGTLEMDLYLSLMVIAIALSPPPIVTRLVAWFVNQSQGIDSPPVTELATPSGLYGGRTVGSTNVIVEAGSMTTDAALKSGPSIQSAKRATNHKASVTRRFRFEAAHRLAYHNGKCNRLHGHSYVLEITARSRITFSEKVVRGGEAQTEIGRTGTSDHGMAFDFGDLKEIVQSAIIDVWDHQDLTKVAGCYPTAELLAHRVWDRVEPELPPDVIITHIRLAETEHAWVDITPEDRV